MKKIIIVPKAGKKRDFLIAKIKKLYHQKEELKWGDSGRIWRTVCKYCRQEKFKSKEICPARISRESTWPTSALKFLDEILSDSNISFVDLKIEKKFAGTRDKLIYKIRTRILIDLIDKDIEIEGISIPDVISHLWIVLMNLNYNKKAG